MQDNPTTPPPARKRNGKPPAFQFYAKDWLTSPRVRLLTLEGRGLFIDLLAISWDAHGLPADPEKIRVLAGASKWEWKRLWPKVRPLWIEVGPEAVDNRIGGKTSDQPPSKLGPTSDQPRRFVNAKQEVIRGIMDAKRADNAGTYERGKYPRQVDNPCGSVSIQSRSSSSSLIPSILRSSSSGMEIQEELPSRTPPRRVRSEVSLGIEGFEEFWSEYPRKRERASAARAYEKARKGKTADELRDAVVDSVDLDWRFRPLDRVPYAASWLNAGGHEDILEDQDRGQPFADWWVKAETKRLQARIEEVPETTKVQLQRGLDRMLGDQERRVRAAKERKR